MFQKLRRDKRIQFVLAIALILVFVLAVIASQYGETGVEIVEGERRVYTDGEHCALTLPDGWSWRPASWSAESPQGTILGFSEQLYGRPEHPEWEESSSAMAERNQAREDATVEVDEDTVRVDYGPQGGLSILQRFDRVGCLLTFSGAGENRAGEAAVWDEIIASLVRTSPTDTPEEDLPWKTD